VGTAEEDETNTGADELAEEDETNTGADELAEEAAIDDELTATGSNPHSRAEKITGSLGSGVKLKSSNRESPKRQFPSLPDWGM
jgi:hypothetical protein